MVTVRAMENVKRVFVIPQRYVLGIMGFFSVVNAYIMRVILSVAITEMVQSRPQNNINSTTSCVYNAENHTVSSVGTSAATQSSGDLYAWTSEQEGLILSAFYWGYVITHIPGGMIAERYGGKYVLGLGILSTSVFTCITPLIIYATEGNWLWVVIVRLLEGLGEGVTFPALTTLLANWVPSGERSKIGTLVYSGCQVGTVVGNAMSGAIIEATGSWANVFYIAGAAGCIWFVIFMFLCYGDPSSHPFITEKEKLYLKAEVGNVAVSNKRVPYRQMFMSSPLWALAVVQIGHDWGLYSMLTDLPKYMKEILLFNVKENGLLSSLPYILMWIVSMITGWICDWLILRKYLTITTARKLFTTIASMGPAVFILIAAYSGCDRVQAVVMFTIGMGFMGTFYSGMKVNPLDLSPNFAGTVMAIVNGLGGLTGIIAPYVIGIVTDNHTLSEWILVFWITFGIFTVTNLVFVVFGSGEVQPWNDQPINEGADITEVNATNEKDPIKL